MKRLLIYVGVIVGFVAGSVGADLFRGQDIDVVKLVVTSIGALLGAGVVILMTAKKKKA